MILDRQPMREKSQTGRKSQSQASAIDLFAGCGGLSLGLKRAGLDVVAAVEIDALAAETYRANHPEVVLWHADIRKISARALLDQLSLERGELVMLAGCPPCQGFSSVKTLNGARIVRDRDQKDLLFQFLRFVRVLKPKYLMLENVPGLAKDYRFRVFLKKIRALGYRCEHKVLNAADFGVPQRRRRLILLGSRVASVSFAAPLAKQRTVADAIRALPLPRMSTDPLHKSEEHRLERTRKLIKAIPRNGGSRGDLGKRFQLKCHRKCDGFKDIYGRMEWDKISPTITSGCINPSKGRFLHPTQNRAITLREASLLQGFPPKYWFPMKRGRYAVAAMIGNALPPEFVRRHARELVGLSSRRCYQSKLNANI
jgi:DNA (cytosine-5)-methyltransferase 1